MLLPFIILSLILIEQTNGAEFNHSEVITGRSGRQNYYGRMDPSLYYMNYSPFRPPYWLYSWPPPYAGEKCDFSNCNQLT